MMKILICFICAIVTINAFPRDPDQLPKITSIKATNNEKSANIPDLSNIELVDLKSFDDHSRSKRATCDLLSGFGVNHSACALHCKLRGNPGGYCSPKAVCICRRRR